MRELVANALVHRDLGPHALGDRVHLVLEADRLVLVNPGGLYGLTVEQLGHRVGGSARNQSLYDIVKDVRTVDGRRIIEGVGTGIVAARQALHAAGMTPPHFLDSGVRFTAMIPQHALLDAADLAWVAMLPGPAGCQMPNGMRWWPCATASSGRTARSVNGSRWTRHRPAPRSWTSWRADWPWPTASVAAACTGWPPRSAALQARPGTQK